ncbi:TonB-dependent receptor [Sphingomonas cynarae]
MSRRRSITRNLVWAGTALGSLALALAAGGAEAQAIGAVPADGQATAAPAGQPAHEDGLSEIVVTASRREESAKDVPVAVAVIAGEKLDVLNSSGLDVRFLAARVPSLQVESSFGRTFPRFYIRGLGNTDFDPNAAQPVSVVYDDVALESPMLKSFPVFDLQSVQVLRGPQGTLFGRNTPAGVVKLDSVRPSETPSAYASLSVATYNTVNAEAASGGPIGGGFSYRVSTLLQRRDDWVRNTSASSGTSPLASPGLEGYLDYAGRVQIAYSGGDFNALANVHGRELEGSPRIFRAGLFQRGNNRFTLGFDKDVAALDGITDQSLTQWGANLHLDYHLAGLGTLYSITAYERATVNSVGDIDGGDRYPFSGGTIGQLNVGLFPSNTGGRTKPREFSQEVRFATDDLGGVRLQAGGYYFRQRLNYDEYAFSGSTVSTQDIRHRNRNENYGIFASAEYKPVDDLTVRGGVRYSHDKRRDLVEGFSPGLTPGLTLPITTRVTGDNVSWDASATYALTDAVNVYGRFATGYLGPAIQDRVTFGSLPTTAAKQTTISGEGGIKAQLSRVFRFDLTGYWNRTKDLQLTAVGGATNSARLLNADKAIGYGVEAEIEARPMPNLTFTASGSYNFTEIRDGDIAVAPCGSGLCTVRDPLNAAGLAVIDGNDLPQAPRWIANATARYAIPLANGDQIFAYGDVAYRGKINYFLYEAAEFRGRASTELGLKIGYKTADNLELSVFGRNLLNQIRSISAIDFNNLTGMINEPRIIGGMIRFTY